MRSFLAAVVWVYGLSSFSLASELSQRFSPQRLSVFHVYAGLLAVTTALSAVTLGDAGDLPAEAVGWLGLLLVGAAASEVVVRADRAILRRARRRAVAADRPVARAHRARPHQRRPRVAVPTDRLGSTAARRQVGRHRTPLRPIDQVAFGAPALMAAIAVLEEFVFRGFLLNACLSLRPAAAALATVGLVAAFALSHIWFGWVQVLAKTPLSVITTAIALMTGGIVAAIVAHVVFNVRVATRARRHLSPHGRR